MKKLTVALLTLALLSGCTDSDSSPKPAADSNEQMQTKTVQGGRCLEETDSNDSINRDLKNLRDRVHQFKNLNRSLKPEECLAAAAYAKTYDYFGETCVDKNALMLSSWIRNCYNDDWRAGATGHQDCSLPGHKQDIFLYAPTKLRALLTGHLDNCEWGQEERERILDQEVIRRAIGLIRAPVHGELK